MSSGSGDEGDGSLFAAWEAWGEAAFRSGHGSTAQRVSLGFTVLTACVAALHLGSHLKQYSRPRLQRHVVRIIFMAPIYALCSYFTLRTGHHWPNVLRDIYEAWVIYCFLAILFEVLGGEATIANMIKDGSRPPLPRSWFWGTCCLDPLWSSRLSFLKFCKAGTLQFALLKPVCAAIQLVLEAADLYGDSWRQLDRGFPYIALVYNASITLAIYGLVLFYVALRAELASFRPVLKYCVVKSTIFLSYWQGFGLQLVAPSVAAANDAQNFAITIEMALAAVVMALAFPASEFRARAPERSDSEADARERARLAGGGSDEDSGGGAGLGGTVRSMAVNLGRAVNLSDVAAETRTIFGGGYEEHAMLNESADVDMDDVDLRESFADLAMKQGRLPPTLGSGQQKQPAAAAGGGQQWVASFDGQHDGRDTYRVRSKGSPAGVSRSDVRPEPEPEPEPVRLRPQPEPEPEVGRSGFLETLDGEAVVAP